MSRRAILHATVSQAAFTASLAVALAVTVHEQASAQAPAPAVPAAAPATNAPALTLPTMDVQSQVDPANTLQRPTGLSRLPGTIQSTPQVINAIPREVLEQQGVTTLDQALRNVPGITSSIGEGNGGVAGDQFRIRGFSAQNDVYVDGMRDFGSYTRDAFNFDSVSVLKGPSATTFGQQTIGGAINIQTRTPTLTNSISGTISGGTDSFVRGSVDVNRRLNETTAVRLNLMGHYNRVAGRDEVDSGRWGIAPSIAFGLGTPTTLTVDYMHFEDRRTPDYGVPVIRAPGQSVSRPATEYGLRRGNWYGINSDRDNTTVDRVTARLRHEFSDWLTLSNDTRVGFSTRDFAASPPTCDATCTNLFFGRTPQRAMVAYSGGVSPFKQETWGVQNITTAVARFNTGPLRHEATFGLDAWFQDDERTGYTYANTRSNTLINPSHSTARYAILPGTGANVRHTQQRHLGFFATDRVWFTPEISLIGGVRVSNYDLSYKTYGNGAATTVLGANQTFVDPRASLVWEPTPSQTYYFSYASSTTPAGSFITTFPAGLSAATQSLDPERNRIFELGAKFSLMNNRLGLYGSLFRIEKEGAYVTDPVSGTTTQSGDSQRNQGVELGVTGQLTRDWSLSANYVYMDSETTRSATPANLGRRIQYVPRHAASVWSTYEAFRDTPYQLTVGGGVTWRSMAYLHADNTASVPSNFTLDAMLSHSFGERRQWRVAVNGYNLTNELNSDSLFGTRANPSAGRTVIFSLSAAY